MHRAKISLSISAQVSAIHITAQDAWPGETTPLQMFHYFFAMLAIEPIPGVGSKIGPCFID
jgi:hypothetical protein